VRSRYIVHMANIPQDMNIEHATMAASTQHSSESKITPLNYNIKRMLLQSVQRSGSIVQDSSNSALRKLPVASTIPYVYKETYGKLKYRDILTIQTESQPDLHPHSPKVRRSSYITHIYEEPRMINRLPFGVSQFRNF
jgi:hypothetical protein